ncbi:MAG TPA: IS1182 family transposase [Anaerolineae bacterium]
MLGRRDPQQNLFSAQNLPHRVPADSFYGRMAAVSGVLFQDDDLKEMYDPGNGRPSIPPSLMSGVLLLQFHDDVSDEEAVQRLMFDLRWQVALNLPTDFPGFDPSSLTYFRQRLIEHKQERYAFDRFVKVGREAGFIPDRATLLTDTTRTKGAGAVMDTYTLLRKGIRKLLKQLGYAAGKGRGLSAETQRLVATYVEQDRKAKIDWTDPQQRAAQLNVLFQDAEAALELATEHMDDADVRSTGWLLTKILGDDIAYDDQGKPQIADGPAPYRIISITDPEMGHGHKSDHVRFDGFKTAVTTEQSSELIVDIQDIPAAGSDGQALMPTVARVEQNVGLTIERVMGDGAYSSGQNLAACATHPEQPIDLLAPVARPRDAEVDKSAFRIDPDQRIATCPQGHTTTRVIKDFTYGTPTLRFCFERAVCVACPLFQRCVKSKTAGRTVSLHPYESYLQAARQRQQGAAFKSLYLQRSAIERKQAELVQHGLRNTRYRGHPKRQLQRLWQGASVNLQSLFRLCESRKQDLNALLAYPGSAPLRLKTA